MMAANGCTKKEEDATPPGGTGVTDNAPVEGKSSTDENAKETEDKKGESEAPEVEGDKK